MPYTGFDPLTPAQPYDVSGGGYDPSAYYALSPGGRFPGDVQNYLEYLAALSRGTAGSNPSYDVPDWLQRLPGSGGNMIRRILTAHENNVRTGGTGQSPDLPAGQPHTFFSGPGAFYGPPGGELNGVVDIGRPGIWDGPDDPGLGRGVSTDGGGGGRRGGGGGGSGVQMGAFQSPGQLTFKPSFVGYDPLKWGQSSAPSAIGPSSLYGKPITAPNPRTGGPTPATSNGVTGGGAGGRGGAGGAGGGRGAGRGTNTNTSTSTTPPGAARPATPTAPKPPSSLQEILDWLGGLDPQGKVTDPAQSRMTGADLRNQTFGGIDVGNLDRGTPGWLFDPTTTIVNTGGFPGPTPLAPTAGQSWDDYASALHDQGLSNESIASLLGPYGFGSSQGQQWHLRDPSTGIVDFFKGDPSKTETEWTGWKWGTGPVVRGENGYEFARQAGGGGGVGKSEGGMTTPDPRAWGDVLRR